MFRMRRCFRSTLGRAVAAASAALGSSTAHASLFAGETLDKVANVVAIVVIIVVPIVLIALFWMVHVLPEKIAHKRHHPQRDAIHTLCLLSLVFGGILWPLAWLWAYTKPVFHKMSYGTDKHDDYFAEYGGQESLDDAVVRERITRLRAEVDSLIAGGGAPEGLARVKEQLAALELRVASAAANEGAG